MISNTLWVWIRKKTADIFGEENTYDYLPDLNVTEFAYVSGFMMNDIDTKTNIGRIARVQIDVYTADWMNRIDTIKKIEDLRAKLRAGVKINGKTIECMDTSIQYTQDNTTSIALFRGMLEAEFKYY